MRAVERVSARCARGATRAFAARRQKAPVRCVPTAVPTRSGNASVVATYEREAREARARAWRSQMLPPQRAGESGRWMRGSEEKGGESRRVRQARQARGRGRAQARWR